MWPLGRDIFLVGSKLCLWLLAALLTTEYRISVKDFVASDEINDPWRAFEFIPGRLAEM